MEGSSGFTAKSWDCPTYLWHKLVGRRGQWWSSHAPVAENVPPSRVSAGRGGYPKTAALPACPDEGWELLISD